MLFLNVQTALKPNSLQLHIHGLYSPLQQNILVSLIVMALSLSTMVCTPSSSTFHCSRLFGSVSTTVATFRRGVLEYARGI